MSNTYKTNIKKTETIKYIIYFFVISIVWTLYDSTGILYKFSHHPDANIYYAIGKQLGTKVLYQDLYDNKGPYIFFIGYLSNRLFHSMLLFYIMDLAAILLFAHFVYKYISTYCFKKYVFIISCVIVLIFLPYANTYGAPEFAYLGFNSYLLLWLFKYKKDKDNSINLFVFGLFGAFVLLTKFNIILGYGLCILFYFYQKYKCKFFVKELICLISGFTVGSTPFAIYGIKTKSLFLAIETYVVNAFNYASDKDIESEINIIAITFLLALACFRFCFKNKEYFDKEVLIFIALLFGGNIISIAIGSKIWFNYFVPLFPFIVLIIKNVGNKPIKKDFYNYIYLCVYFLVIASICFISVLLYAYTLTKQSCVNIFNYKNTSAYAFYNDYADKIDEDTKMMCYLSFYNDYQFYFFDDQPNYKYYTTICFRYDYKPEMYEDMYEKIVNQEMDYILLLEDTEGNYCVINYLEGSDEYIARMQEALDSNYVVEKIYCYPDNLYLGDKERILKIMVPVNR